MGRPGCKMRVLTSSFPISIDIRRLVNVTLQTRGGDAEQRSQAFAKRWNNRALEIDLTIEPHQNLNRLYLRVVPRRRAALVHELVSEVFNGVSRYFESLPGLAVGLATVHGLLDDRIRRVRSVAQAQDID